MFDNITPYKEIVPTFRDAIEIHKLIERGFPHSQIAALYKTNAGRISEIKTGKRHNGSYEQAFG
ncbi:MAG: hypothetical protein V3U82_01785 [Robiginitomaculum sp.]